MNKSKIIELQSRVGTVPDGFWGPKSIAACQRHLRKMMPQPHPWPRSSVSAITRFYGRHGDRGGYTPPLKKIQVPYDMRLYSASGGRVRNIAVHAKIADAVLWAFEDLLVIFPTARDRRAAGIDVFDGCYNPRRMRGGTSWSMHAWAIALDFNAAKNGNQTAWPARATMPLEVMEVFARHGFMAAGAFWGRDAMHFQATQ